MPEDPQREVCLCFHVPVGKLVKYYRLHRPRIASQFTGCGGAGTGCGWCVPHLERLHAQLAAGAEPDLGMSIEEYRTLRAAYQREKKPLLPPAPDANGRPLDIDLDEVTAELPEEERLD